MIGYSVRCCRRTVYFCQPKWLDPLPTDVCGEISTPRTWRALPFLLHRKFNVNLDIYYSTIYSRYYYLGESIDPCCQKTMNVCLAFKLTIECRCSRARDLYLLRRMPTSAKCIDSRNLSVLFCSFEFMRSFAVAIYLLHDTQLEWGTSALQKKKDVSELNPYEKKDKWIK